MKVKDHPALLKVALNPDLDDMPGDVGEMDVEEFRAWSEAAADDAEANLRKTEGQLAIAKEIAFLTQGLFNQHPNLPLSELIPLLPEPRRSRVKELVRQMPERIQIPMKGEPR
jgi:hypothetical protein